MKNFLIVLILAALVIPAAPWTAEAAAFSDAVRMDFSDFTAADSGGGTYKTYFTYGNIAGNTSAKTITAERGVSVEMLSPSAGDQYINWRAEFNKNAVFGFSVYPADIQAGCGVALKGVSGQWDDTSINSFIMVSGGSITLNGASVYSYTGPEWIDITVAMNYQTHTIALYVNNQFKGTMTMKEAVVGCQYMNLSLQKNKTGTDGKPAKLYFDDFFSYYPSSAHITNDFDSSIVNAGEVDSITLNFGQNVILDDIASAVAINGEYMEITPVYQYGFMTGAIALLQNLMPKTEYTITLNGVRNLIGETLSYSYKFSTIDDSPMVSISSDYQGKKLPEGAKVEINLSSANLAAEDTIELYLNGELMAQAPADAKAAAVLLRGGMNRVYAKVAGTDVVSNTIELEAIGYTRLSEEYATDFEGANPLGGLGRGAGDGKL